MTGERRAVVKNPDGTEQDITDLVRLLYDGVVGSLDWGSGWWSGEDAAAVGWIGLAFGWASGDQAAEFAREIQKYERFREALDIALPVPRSS